MNKTTRKITVGVAALAALAFVGFDSHTASARGFGIHYSGPNVHFGIGHSYGHNSRSYQSRTAYQRPPQEYCPSTRKRGPYAWHDTSHYAYHPGQFVRHGSHFDYRPGRYDFHRTGHYDFRSGGHRKSGPHRDRGHSGHGGHH